MENYNELSVIFRKLLNRIKIILDRQKILKRIIDECTNEQFIRSEQFEEIQQKEQLLCFKFACTHKKWGEKALVYQQL